MSKIEDSNFKLIEPLKANRWVIDFTGLKISPYLFVKYKIFNDGDKLMFSVRIYETVNGIINPLDFFKINNIKIEFLDSTGSVVNGYVFSPKGIQFEQLGDYSVDNLLTYYVLIEIDKNNFYPIFKNTGGVKNG